MARLNAEFERVKKLTTGTRRVSVRLNKKWEKILQRRRAEWKEEERRRTEIRAKARSKALAEAAEYNRKRAERYAKRAAANTPRIIERSRRSRIDWFELIDNPVTVQRQIQWERRATALAMHKAGLSYSEIGKRLGVTRSRAAQVVFKAEQERKHRKNQVSPAEAFMNADLHKEVSDFVTQKHAEQALQPFMYSPHRDWLLVAGGGG